MLCSAAIHLDMGVILSSKPPTAPGEAEARARAPYVLPE